MPNKHMTLIVNIRFDKQKYPIDDKIQIDYKIIQKMEETQKKQNKSKITPKVLPSSYTLKNVLQKKVINNNKSQNNLLSKENINQKYLHHNKQNHQQKIINEDNNGNEEIKTVSITKKKISFQTWLLNNDHNYVKKIRNHKKNSFQIKKKQYKNNFDFDNDLESNKLKKIKKSYHKNNYHQPKKEEKYDDQQIQQPQNKVQSQQNSQQQNNDQSQKNTESSKNVESSSINESQDHKDNEFLHDNQSQQVNNQSQQVNNQQIKSQSLSRPQQLDEDIEVSYDHKSENNNQSSKQIQHEVEKQISKEIQPQQNKQQSKSISDHQISKDMLGQQQKCNYSNQQSQKYVDVQQQGNQKQQEIQVGALQIQSKFPNDGIQQERLNQQIEPQKQQINEQENQCQNQCQNQVQNQLELNNNEQDDKEKDSIHNQNELDNKQSLLNEDQVEQKSLKQMGQSEIQYVTQPYNNPSEHQRNIDEDNKNEQIIQNLKQNNVDTHSQKSYESFNSTESSCQDYLNRIFNYYCKVNFMVVKGATFDQMQQKIRVMLINNFMIFCKDFKITEYIDRDSLVHIFKKGAKYQKYSNFAQFKKSLQSLSQIIFNKQQSCQRYKKLLNFLQINNSVKFIKKMNQLGINFRFKNKRGINVNILSKYQHKLTTNNGKSQDHLIHQVKQLYQQRKIIKQQQIQYHKNNRKNRIEQLYQNMLKKKQKQSKLRKNSLRINPSHSINTRYHHSYQLLTHRNKKNTISYAFIHQLKNLSKNIQPSFVSPQHKSKRSSQKQFQIISQSNLLAHSSLPIAEMKVNEVISQAKRQILVENNQKRLTNTAYLNQQQINSKYLRHDGSIKKQLHIKNIQYNKSRLIRKNCIVEQFVKGQIKGNGRCFNKGFVGKEGTSISSSPAKDNHKVVYHGDIFQQRQMSELKQIIGVNSQVDEFLEKHFCNQEIYYQKNKKI